MRIFTGTGVDMPGVQLLIDQQEIRLICNARATYSSAAIRTVGIPSLGS